MAAERITDEETDSLRALLDSIGPDPAAEELVANDLEFHRRIVACSGNSVLSSLLESMSGPTTRLHRSSTPLDATQDSTQR